MAVSKEFRQAAAASAAKARRVGRITGEYVPAQRKPRRKKREEANNDGNNSAGSSTETPTGVSG